MVRAGEGGRFAVDFQQNNMVGIGWLPLGPLHEYQSRGEIGERLALADPSLSEGQINNGRGQVFRFLKEIAIGDRVITYDPKSRVYLCGDIVGDYEYNLISDSPEYIHQRKVAWRHDFSRDKLSVSARNSLGSTLTLFSVGPRIQAELWCEAHDDQETLEEVQESGALDIEQIANEAIKDAIAALSPSEMEHLIAGILRAMGYRTKVTPTGADRGKDIIASPDGFGFQDPRIVVEVKHRKGKIGAPEIRSFLGGRQNGEKGLYVSTGGFTREAEYEAERANFPVRLMDSEDLLAAVYDNHALFDEKTRQLLPLRVLLWPLKGNDG
ncbi:MAG: restriction endonuclease [Pseudomonadota bacterium]